MEIANKNRLSLQEYDTFNLLDGFVLCLLEDSKSVSHHEIVAAVQNNIAVSEHTVDTCLCLLTINGLVSNRYVGSEHFYHITEEGKRFLKLYSQIKAKMQTLRLNPLNRLQPNLKQCQLRINRAAHTIEHQYQDYKEGAKRGLRFLLSTTFPPVFKTQKFNILMTTETANTDLPLLGFCNEPLLGGKYAN